MANQVKSGAVKIWYRNLQLALNNGVPVSWGFYKAWGTEEELKTLKFATWWRQKGKALFEEKNRGVTLVSADDKGLTVHIPLSINAKEAQPQIAALMLKQRGSRRVKEKGAYALTGLYNYQKLIQYLRYLEIEHDQKYSGKTVEEKSTALRKRYAQIEAKITKRNQTLKDTNARDKRGKLLYKKMVARTQQSFGVNSGSAAGIDAKKISKWTLVGRHVLLNVAEGKFPGIGYNGTNLNQKLKSRLAKLGLAAIGQVVRARGGRRAKVVYFTKQETKERKKLSDKSVATSSLRELALRDGTAAVTDSIRSEYASRSRGVER